MLCSGPTKRAALTQAYEVEVQSYGPHTDRARKLKEEISKIRK